MSNTILLTMVQFLHLSCTSPYLVVVVVVVVVIIIIIIILSGRNWKS
jgi:heme/copper-type cytochrome/quinol oxidase subunit 4